MEKVSCESCGKRFKNTESLEQHNKDAHAQHSPQHHHAKGTSKRKILAIVIPILILLGISYAVYWSLTTASIGSIGSTHIHADFAIYANGQKLTPFPRQLFVASPYVHIEEGSGAGEVIHMHATDVPLSMFFEAIGMKFNSKCFEANRALKFCDDGNSTLKMYVKQNDGQWEQNSEYGDYIFKDLDKILISYGTESEDKIQLQQNNVTDFSKDNSGRNMILKGP